MSLDGKGNQVSSATLVPELVPLPGRTFIMGNDTGRADERPAHRVELAPFRAAVTPVTNAEYMRFVRATGVPEPPFVGDERSGAPRQPVVGISWFDAVAYCAWLSAETGIAFRLPTEAEREYAARGGLAGDWPWPGEDCSGHPAYGEIASLARPHEPLAACANGFGLRCMAENVHEWCSDWYDPRYYDGSPPQNPGGPTTGMRRASRGGAWRHSTKFTRVSARSSLAPSFRYNDFGFRVYA